MAEKELSEYDKKVAEVLKELTKNIPTASFVLPSYLAETKNEEPKTKEGNLVCCMCFYEEQVNDAKVSINKIKPYVDRVVLIGDESVSEKNIEYFKKLGCEVYIHHWNDNFSENRNHYLEHLKEGDWFIVCDCDEYPNEISLEKIKETIAKSQNGELYNEVKFHGVNVSLMLYNACVIKESGWYKPLLHKYYPQIKYTGEVHETLHGPWKEPLILPRDCYYYHIGREEEILRKGIRNFFISGGLANEKDKNPKWVEFRIIAAKLNIKTWHELDDILHREKLPEELEKWIIDNRDYGGTDWSEVQAFSRYYEYLHSKPTTEIAYINQEEPKEKIAMCVMGHYPNSPQFSYILETINNAIDYVDEIVIQAEAFSKTETSALEKYGHKVKFFIELWKDDFSEYKNKLIARTNANWVCTVDHDEIPSRELCESLMQLARDSDNGNKYNIVGFNATNTTLNAVGTVIDQHHGIGKELFHLNIHNCFHGDVHIWLRTDIPNHMWKGIRTQSTYEHRKTELEVIQRSCRNVFLGGGGDTVKEKNPTWIKLRKITEELGIKTWNEFDNYIKNGTVIPKLEELFEEMYNFTWHDDELKMLKTYYEHWKKEKNQYRDIIEKIYTKVLKRGVDNEGLRNYGDLLKCGLITEEEIEQQLYNSDEHRAMILSERIEPLAKKEDLIQKLTEFLAIPESDVKKALDDRGGGGILLDDWHSLNPQTPEEIDNFYRKTQGYLYECTNFHSGLCDGVNFYNRVIYHVLEYLTNIPTEKRKEIKVLDYGGGIGTLSLWYARQGFQTYYYDLESTTQDFAKFRAKKENLKMSFLKENEKIPKNYFDVISAIEVIEHIVDIEGLLKKIYNDLKDNGHFLYTYTFPQTEKEADNYPLHLKQHAGTSREMLEKLLTKVGFHILADKHAIAIKSPQITACILTKNNEEIIENCINKIKDYVDYIAVLDGGSTDKTIEKLKSFGEKVIIKTQNEFTSFPDLRNQLIELAPTDWVIIIDTDEYFEDEEFLKNIKNIISQRLSLSYRFPRKNLPDLTPNQDYQVRLFDKKYCKWVGYVHEKLVLNEDEKQLADQYSCITMPHHIIHMPETKEQRVKRFGRYMNILFNEYEKAKTEEEKKLICEEMQCEVISSAKRLADEPMD